MNISCIDGYTLFGSENIECEENSTWSDSVGNCWKGGCQNSYCNVPIIKTFYLIIVVLTIKLHVTYARSTSNGTRRLDVFECFRILYGYNAGSLVPCE